MSEAASDSGYVRAKVETLERDVIEIKRDVKEIKTTIEQSRGAFRLLIWIAGIMAAMSAGIGAWIGRHT